MSLVEHILLYIPLALVICLVSSALRRESTREILHHTTRLFCWLTATLLGTCVVVYLVMESVLD